MTTLDPRVYGRYQIVRKLAGGGMGRVFLAYDPVLNRQVGLKLIDSGSDQDSLDVIAAERRGSILQDQLAKREPGGRVAQIFDIGDREGYFYIAMEYIEGEDLSELVARGPLAPERAVSIALDILDVLVKAHTFQTVIEDKQHSGIIHGDIKPRNIRITSSGQVKVLDFGIAKAVSMTRSITFNQFGSVPYSSPERLQTGDMDVQSDLWSVAIVLFEMLTGKSYFEAEHSSRLEWLIRNYRALEPSVATLPPGLREILSRALDPDPARRFPSASAFEAALHEWQRYAKGDTGPGNADPDATRRTAYQNPEERTRRSNGPAPGPPPRAIPVGTPKPVRRRPDLIRTTIRAFLLTGAVVFFSAVYVVVHEVRLYQQSDAIRKQIDSGQLALSDGRKDYDKIASKSIFPVLLYGSRHSLLEHYEAEADRVISDYREASESTPVYSKDWRRAESALAAAQALSPEDKNVRGKYDVAAGFLALRSGQLSTARRDFEEARGFISHSPDPHLGLAQIYMLEGDIDRARSELNEAQKHGFQPGRREQRSLADGYRKRGERFLAGAKHTHDLGQMQDLMRRADDDLKQAQSLYESVAPFWNGAVLAERVATERARAEKTLAEAEQARQNSQTGDSSGSPNPSGGNP
ncbi:MAG TPA: protein kinase [Bryobacteraceae bacterium]|nr:protein kinase [Bryobacteraceae bacterium]